MNKLKLFFTPLLIVLLVVSVFSQEESERDYAANVTIVRDKWGMPHIFGETDPDVAYGLAWANSEDDFKTIQWAILAAEGHLGLVEGKEGAIIDFFRHAIGTDEIVEEKYKTHSKKFRSYLDGYAAGLNDYAELHPDEVLLKQAFPITAIDLAKAQFVSLALLSKAHLAMKHIIKGDYDGVDLDEAGIGSNAFAFSSMATEDGRTYLCINPHQPFEGPFSWYEAHLVSEEGMNITGATFPGGASIYVGVNENLAWAHTSNGIDLTDVFQLEMHPDKELTYKFDDEWYQLEERKVKLKVKLKKWLFRIPVKKTTYWSIYGPTFKSKDGKFYAIRYPANSEIRAPEQWYWMNKATNIKEFKAALKLEYIPKFNVIYADKEDNIFYLNDGLIPKRDTSFCWTGVVPGNTSKTLWKECYPIESLPWVENPECGYVYNMNNTPHDATCQHEDTPVFLPENMGFRTGNTNRSMRFRELMDKYPTVSFEDMKKIKFDQNFPDSSVFLSSINNLFELDEEQYPDIKGLIRILKNWDQQPTPDSKAASILLATFGYLFEEKDFDDQVFRSGMHLDDAVYAEALRYTKKHLEKYFGTIEVPLSEIQRHRRGDVDLPLPGFPDVMAAAYSKQAKDGRYVGFIGDSYTMFVAFDKTGPVRIESLHPYGTSSKPDSPHYTDQMELYINHQTKKLTLDREEVFKNAKQVYQPKESKTFLADEAK